MLANLASLTLFAGVLGAASPTLLVAMRWATIIALMSLLAAWLQHVLGDVGVLVAALCVAWVMPYILRRSMTANAA